jgi:hypothetical protein
MMTDESKGFGPGFWGLDGSHMDDGFVFSSCETLAEWEEEQRRWREFNEEFAREHPRGSYSPETGWTAADDDDDDDEIDGEAEPGPVPF